MSSAAPRPTGMPLVDGLADLDRPTVADFVGAASEYVVACETLGPLALDDGATVSPPQRKKAGQIRLSAGLGRALAADLADACPRIHAVSGEIRVSGALRTSQFDVVEMTQLDGLKLAIELKPINLAVGRALWNRFGDLRVGAVSTHLKYPYAVCGGVLTIPTWESSPSGRRSTVHLIERVIEALRRAGGRVREDDAPHRHEAVAVVVFDPTTGRMSPDLPAVGSGLRWEEAVVTLARVYDERFPPDLPPAPTDGALF